ncbi:MAG: 3-dehydroquinate synthase [Planctomycetota bacterium]|jgi:3-dehydroquinate synthase
MLDSIEVPLGDRSYPIHLNDSFETLGEAILRIQRPSRVIIISDDQVGPLYLPLVKASLEASDLTSEHFTFPAGEDAKSLAQASLLYDAVFGVQADRKTAILALGGGVTGDLAGFIAATFMRGIPFIQAPTSLLAQVDSSVGGKVAVNHPLGKNMIGAFHQPILVYTNLKTLSTLPAAQFASGMAEVIKHGIIRNTDYFDFIESESEAIRSLNPNALSRVISGSCQVKATVVAEDEREGGVRAILNLGHTFGHALESLTHYTGYRHGEAVSIGMIAACRLAEELLNFPSELTTRIQGVCDSYALPTQFAELSTEAILQSMFGDKKTEHGTLRLILPERLGHAAIHSVTDLDAVRRAIDAVREGATG